MAKRKRLNLGGSDFKYLIENNYYYIDKSLLIEEVINTEKAVLLLPRPRRFGKTLNLSMLRYYFDIQETKNENLFTGLNICETDDFVKDKQSKFPVIYMTFKDAKEEQWKDCYNLIVSEIVSVYRHHRYLLDSDVLFQDEKDDYLRIIHKKAKETDYQNSVKQLSEYLYRYHGQNTIILIDEYDAPIQLGYNKYYNEVIAFMRNLLSGAFKDNKYLYKGVITGILRVSKESIFSGLNNLSVYSILQNRFADKFGFTEDEVKQIVHDFEIEPDYAEIKNWYNGYRFGNTENIYNPWAILSYAAEHEEGFTTYWANTSSDTLIKRELKEKGATDIREDFLKLINNETIVKEIEENFVFPELDTKKQLIWTLLTYSGYLTMVNKNNLYEYHLRIPNYEIKTIFQRTVIDWLETDVKLQKSLLRDTTNFLINNKIPEFEQGFRKIIGDTFSYYDTAVNYEYVYHSYMLGVLAIIGDEYIIKSNRESGEGRYDILLLPHDTQKNGAIIEIKRILKQDKNEPETQFRERVNSAIKQAASQIDTNKYYKELMAHGLEKEQIVKVPVVFAGKEPYCTLLK